MTMMPDAISKSNELSPKELLDILRRRKMIVLQVVIVVLTVGVLMTFLTKATYRASTEILVEGKTLTFAQVDTKDPLNELFSPRAGYDVSTQIEVLQSQLVLDDAFKTAGVPPSGVKLNIKQVQDTNVITISADSTVPDYATRIAKVLPKTYLKYITGNRKSEVTNALEFAKKRLEEEEKKLNEAEKSLERFRKGQNVVDITTQKQAKITATSASETDVRKAEAAVESARARLDSLVRERNALQPIIENKTTTSNIQQIEDLKDKIATLQSERQKLLVLFKPTSPEVEKVDAQIASLTQRLNSLPETRTIVTRTVNPSLATYADKIAEARASLQSAQAELGKVRGQLTTVSAGADKYASIERAQSSLQREMDRRLGTVNLLAQKVEDLSIREKASHDPVLVITPAGDAGKIGPKLFTNLLMALLFGLVLGVSLGILQEYLDDHIHTPEEARRLLGANALGYVPMVKGQEVPLLTQKDSTTTLESFRVLRSNVQFATIDQSVTSLQITSSQSGEGKSMTASNLAIAMAMDGKRVILVDADLRLPTLHAKLGLPQFPGLTNVLLNKAKLEDALREVEAVPGLRVLPAGTTPPNPAELLNSMAMRELHARLEEDADVVIYDSPPTLAAADAQVLSARVDGVIYVMQMGNVKKSAVRHAAELLQQAHARVLGIVFNKIELSNNRDNYYYYGYGNYYHAAQNGSAALEDADDGEEMAGLLPTRESAASNSAKNGGKEA